MNDQRYSIQLIWSDEDQAYLAKIPELPGCVADGNTPEEAIANLAVIRNEWIETAKELHREIPKPLTLQVWEKLAEKELRHTEESIQEQATEIAQTVVRSFFANQLEKSGGQRGPSLHRRNPGGFFFCQPEFNEKR